MHGTCLLWRVQQQESLAPTRTTRNPHAIQVVNNTPHTWLLQASALHSAAVNKHDGDDALLGSSLPARILCCMLCSQAGCLLHAQLPATSPTSAYNKSITCHQQQLP